MSAAGQVLKLPLQQDGAGGAAGVLQQALNSVAPTLLVGGLELGLWNFAASSTQARPHHELVPVAVKGIAQRLLGQPWVLWSLLRAHLI